MKNFEELFGELAGKAETRPPESGTVRLLDAGVHAIGKKLIEEAGEAWIAAEHESDEHLALELSQVLYYVQTMAIARGLSLDDIYRHL